VELDLFADDAAEARTIVQTQQSLIDTQEKLGSMLDAMPIGLLFHTEQGILFANQEACRLLKADKKALSGQHFLDYIRDTELDATSSFLQNAFETRDSSIVTESVIRCRDNAERLTKVIAGRLPWEGTPVIQVLFQDITDQKRTEHSLRKLSITDELTGAYNRRHVFYEASSYISQTTPPPMSVVLMDIDHFKAVNDTYGHATGDLILKELARLAHDFVPKIPGCDSAIFGRIGGEEFLILLPGLDVKAAIPEAEAFREAVARLSIPSESGEMISLTISAGVADYRSSDQTFDALLSRADEALYRAKSGGRNAVCVAE
jgi:diguanylate cyclase (GGDEF)-like protein/PAS domain S-box-containing protein